VDPNPGATRDAIRAELESARASFHALLGSLTGEDWSRQSLNPGWTNGEILVHIFLAFQLTVPLVPLTRLWGRLPRGSSRVFARTLDALTGPFNWLNALGARAQGRTVTRDRIGGLYDEVHFSVIKTLGSIRDEEWQRGMYYPTKWDPSFKDFMTLEDVYRYVLVHFNLHLAQIATPPSVPLAISKEPVRRAQGKLRD
jgi:hypothetical protein